MKICKECQATFEDPQILKDFLKKSNLPDPTICPDCRRQRRFAFRNERYLYNRKCDLTGKDLISIYSPNSPYKVYDQHEWHSDKWDGKDYGRDFDFTRPFFEQMHELMLATPKLSLFATNNDNSDYVNGAQQDKNCYMIFVSDHNQDCYYSYGIDNCTDCAECLQCIKCELCIECVDCSECYNLAYGEKSHGCRDSMFISDCRGCQDCVCCFGLRNKKYHILNQEYSKEEYEKKLASLKAGNYDSLQQLKKFFEEQKGKQQIHQYYDGKNNENSSGDHILSCKSCVNCYDSADLEDCANLTYGYRSRDCFDGYVVVDNCELCYETVSTIAQYNTFFTFLSFNSNNSQYLDHSPHCKNCFACSGLKKAEYCIFNKQYSKEEYEIVKNKIIEHMKITGEYGQFFPIKLSPFAYNETLANEYYPLSKSEVHKRAWNWSDEAEQAKVYTGEKVEVPNEIANVTDDITEKIFTCEKSGKPFKITAQELKAYRKHNLPLPHLSFNERHLERLQKRNPRKLWARNCQKCKKEIQSSYAPERPEIVYCEECYLEKVY